MLILLSAVSCSNPVGSQISPDIESILYIRQGQGFKELAAMRPDGSPIKVILRLGGNFDRIDAARWSPDKSRIVLAGGQLDSRPGVVDVIPLWIIDNNGTFIRELTFDGRKPVWSRNGEKIFFMKSEGPNVYSVNTNGTNEEMVHMDADSIIFQLTDVSVSGQYIFGFELFTFNTDDGKLNASDLEIVRIDLQSGEKTFFTDNEQSDAAPRLSNDGNKIAYYHRVSEGIGSFNRITNVYMMDSDGQNSQNITNLTNLNLSFPFITWSPDGSFIGFNKANQLNSYNGSDDIFLVEVSTGKITQLTFTNNINDMIMDWK